jgi:phage shock protein PspC (stress-responsive transcriptional regulator)
MVKKLRRSKIDRMLSGVCGGIANYLNIDSTIIRVIFAILTVVGVGSPIIVYLVLIFVMPEEGAE